MGYAVWDGFTSSKEKLSAILLSGVPVLCKFVGKNILFD
jgi:hypothetical protein